MERWIMCYFHSEHTAYRLYMYNVMIIILENSIRMAQNECLMGHLWLQMERIICSFYCFFYFFFFLNSVAFFSLLFISNLYISNNIKQNGRANVWTYANHYYILLFVPFIKNKIFFPVDFSFKIWDFKLLH